jgi:polyhydroxyalkanoate synthesis regulator phasin
MEMDVEKEILENRGQIALLEAKLKAIIELLSKEGLVDEDEFEEFWKDIARGKGK